MTALKASWTVRGGLVPKENFQPELTKRWEYTSDDYEADCEATAIAVKAGETPTPPGFDTCRKEAVAYWETLNDPRLHNWAEITFIWY